MSLLDSLLLEPHKLDVWIAIRSDGGAKGSGTENDPYNATPRQEGAIPITGLSNSGREATATTGTNHQYSNGDVVIIAGVTGAGTAPFNGRFSIYGKTDTTFKYGMLEAPTGSPTLTNATCARVVFAFDELMYPGFPEYTAIHLGPGVFETRGFSQTNGGWFPKSGWKFVGSGIDVTTLKIVHGNGAEIGTEAHFVAIGTFIGVNIDYFEASDFTVDCNLAGQPIPPAKDFSPVACGAIRVGGSHSRIRRVRAINFGSQTVTKPVECFVLTTAWPHPSAAEVVDCVIEDCIVEQPSLNNTDLTSCIGIGAFVERGAFHRGCVIRNCVVNCEFLDKPALIKQITFSATTATVETWAAHGRVNNDWVRISGARVDGSLDNPFNGSFRITNATSTTFQYTMASTPTAQPTGDIWVGRFSSHLVAIDSTSRDESGPPYKVTVVTKTPHFRVEGNNIRVSGVLVGGDPVNAFNGAFTIKEVLGPKTLTYEISTAPGTPDVSFAALGTAYHALGVTGGTGAVLEGCHVYHTRFGNYGDTYSSKDLVVRNNFFHDVVCGVYHSMGNRGTLLSGSTLTRNGLLATFTAQLAHGLLPWSAVLVADAVVNGTANNPFNGYFEIDSIPATPTDANGRPTSFTYLMSTEPATDASGDFKYAEFWRIVHHVVENNVIELALSLPANHAPSVGVQLVDNVGATGAPEVYLQTVIRSNVVRTVGDASDARALGIYLHRGRDGIIEENVISELIGEPLRQTSCGLLRYMNNMTPAGQLLQGFNFSTSRKVDELATMIEDAAILSF